MSALIMNKPTHGEYLFIGGGQDGLRRYVSGPRDFLRFPVKTNIPDVVDLEKTIPYAKVMQEEEYCLLSVHGNENRFYVYLLSSLSGDDLMKALLRGYGVRS